MGGFQGVRGATREAGGGRGAWPHARGARPASFCREEGYRGKASGLGRTGGLPAGPVQELGRLQVGGQVILLSLSLSLSLSYSVFYFFCSLFLIQF